jgi:hypothetical protein
MVTKKEPVQISGLESLVSAYTDTDLQTELARRKQAREKEKHDQHRTEADKIETVFANSDRTPRDIVDVLCPEHTKGQDCQDNQRWDGFDTTSDSRVRCLRCVLLDLTDGQATIPYPLVLTLSIESKWYDK